MRPPESLRASGIGDGDATRLGGGDVDTVVAHAHHRDDLQRRQPGDEFGTDLRFAAGGDGADLRRQAHEGGRVGLVQAVVHGVGGVQLRRPQRRQLGDGEDVDGFGHAAGT
jgi:hypothetical protein